MEAAYDTRRLDEVYNHSTTSSSNLMEELFPSISPELELGGINGSTPSYNEGQPLQSMQYVSNTITYPPAHAPRRVSGTGPQHSSSSFDPVTFYGGGGGYTSLDDTTPSSSSQVDVYSSHSGSGHLYSTASSSASPYDLNNPGISAGPSPPVFINGNNEEPASYVGLYSGSIAGNSFNNQFQPTVPSYRLQPQLQQRQQPQQVFQQEQRSTSLYTIPQSNYSSGSPLSESAQFQPIYVDAPGLIDNNTLKNQSRPQYQQPQQFLLQPQSQQGNFNSYRAPPQPGSESGVSPKFVNAASSQAIPLQRQASSIAPADLSSNHVAEQYQAHTYLSEQQQQQEFLQFQQQFQRQQQQQYVESSNKKRRVSTVDSRLSEYQRYSPPSQDVKGKDTSLYAFNLISNAGKTSPSTVQRSLQADDEDMRHDNVAMNGASTSAAGTQKGKKSASATTAEKASNKKPVQATVATASAVALDAGKKKKAGGSSQKGHNDVERRYRNNINNHLAALRDAIPALRHLKPLPSMPPSRRRASQFTLSTAATAPTPEGLVDGVLAAKTLSKGSILGKSIEYINYLQGQRADLQEDVELFKAVVLELVGDGKTLVDVFDARRAARDVERAARRESERQEQRRMDEEDGASNEDDEEDDTLAATRGGATAKSSSRKAASHTTSSSSGGTSPNQGDSPPRPNGLVAPQTTGQQQGNPLLPGSASEDARLSPRALLQAQQYRGHSTQPPRVLLASFMGLTFAGGVGYDLSYNAASHAAGDSAGARAWATRLAKRAFVAEVPQGGSPSIMTSTVVGPAVVSGLVALGLACLLLVLVFVLRPSLFAYFGTGAIARSTTHTTRLSKSEQTRGAYGQRRRAQALAALARLKHASASTPTVAFERRTALAARQELLKLVGAPRYAFWLLPEIGKEALTTIVRKIGIVSARSRALRGRPRDEALEIAAAWIRLAEIETTIGPGNVSYVSRCYTFLRLYNLSRSSDWPDDTAATALPSVNALLSLHLLSLGQPLSAQVLWKFATQQDQRQSRGESSSLWPSLQPWAEIAISCDFATVRAIYESDAANVIDATETLASPSDTVPLLRISEVHCAAALREAWAKIFVGIVQTTCPPHAPQSSTSTLADLVDLPFLEDTVVHVLKSTVAGSPVHSLAMMTHSVCLAYSDRVAAGQAIVRNLLNEWRGNGTVSRLQSARAFLQLSRDHDANPYRTFGTGPPGSQQQYEDLGNERGTLAALYQADLIATAALGWLLVRRHTSSAPTGSDLKADPILHADTLMLRRLLGRDVFRDPALRRFCAVPSSASDWSSSAPATATKSSDLDLDAALDVCMDALVGATRRAAGLRPEDDSGVECD